MHPNLTETANNSYQECLPYENTNSISMQTLVAITFSFLLLGALISNVLLVTVFFKRFAQLRSPVNCFIVNMAVSDLFVPFFVFPKRLQEIYLGYGPWLVDGLLGDILCRLVHFGDEVSVAVSTQSMVIIAVERWWSIVFPMKPALISQRSTPKFIAFTWIFALLFFFFYFFGYKLRHKNGKPLCLYTLPEFFETWEDLWRFDRVILLAVFVIIPFIVLTICYAAIAWSIYRQSKRNQNLGSEAQKQRTHQNRRITLMLIAVVVLFLMSWTPYYVYFFIQYYPAKRKVACASLKIYYQFVVLMNYIYTVFNPVIYYIFSANYRREFREVFCRSSNNIVNPQQIIMDT